MIGVGIIGTGSIAGDHGKALRGLPDRARIVAAADTDAERGKAFAAEFAVGKLRADYHEVLADPEVHMVCVCTPNATHPRIVVEALEAGKSVLCEKPIAGSLAECDVIAEAQRRTGGIVSSVFGWRYGLGYRAVRELLERGVAGRVLWAQVNVLWRRTGSYYGGWRGTWQGERAGPLITLAIHAIDAVLSLLPAPREVEAFIDRFTHDVEVEDTSTSILRMADGSMLNINCTSSNQSSLTTVHLVCERMFVSSGTEPYTTAQWPWSFSSEDPETREAIEEMRSRTRPATEEPPHLSQIRDFLDHLERGESGPVTVSDARRSLEAITAIYKAAFTGSPVRLPIAADDPFAANMNGGRKLRGSWGK